MKIEASTVEIEERGVKLRLTVVDTPGFADAINNDDRCGITCCGASHLQHSLGTRTSIDMQFVFASLAAVSRM